MREHTSKHLIWTWKFQLYNLAEDIGIGDQGNASYLAGTKNYFLTMLQANIFGPERILPESPLVRGRTQSMNF
jgi:hypothetical protein